jgi:hypothetical protein
VAQNPAQRRLICLFVLPDHYCSLIPLFSGSSCAFTCCVRLILAVSLCIAYKACFLYPYPHVRAIFHVQAADFVARFFFCTTRLCLVLCYSSCLSILKHRVIHRARAKNSLFHQFSPSFESSSMPEDDFDIYGEDEGFDASANAQVGRCCTALTCRTSHTDFGAG